MIKVKENFRVILIGGSSNTGKSTIAKLMAKELGWSFLSTDSLARHPGRPWQVSYEDIPKHVVEHYSTLSADDLFKDVLRHYQGVWVNVKEIISLVGTDKSQSCLIIEGSALWPEFVVDLEAVHTKSIWLTTTNDIFQDRIYRESNLKAKSAPEKYLIEKFLARTILYNKKMMTAITRLGLMSITVDDTISSDKFSEICLKKLLL
jgi:2-phosphoglycerate kinase